MFCIIWVHWPGCPYTFVFRHIFLSCDNFLGVFEGNFSAHLMGEGKIFHNPPPLSGLITLSWLLPGPNRGCWPAGLCKVAPLCVMFLWIPQAQSLRSFTLAAPSLMSHMALPEGCPDPGFPLHFEMWRGKVCSVDVHIRLEG